MDAVPPGSILLRPMQEGDLGAIAGIARAQGRNVGEDDYRRFLALEGARGVVVERDGEVLGGATVMRYFEHGFLGPVLLDARADSAGLAIALLAQLIETVQREGVDVIEAEAAAVEEAILARMGFSVLRETVVLERPAGAHGGPPESEAMRAHHLLDVGGLDAAVVGYGRKEYLAALMHDLPAGARVVVRGGEVEGYALLRRAPHGYQMGPLVTRDEDAAVASALLRSALHAADGAPVVALAPEGDAAALFEANGFRRVGGLARMRAGARVAPSELPMGKQWALGGRITG